jgi:apolipoprotein N-acyltransferase
MQWAASYIGSNFALILVVALAVIALGAVAWFAKNWKVAVAAVVVLGLGLAYQQIDKNAYQRAVAEQAAAKVAILQDRLDALTKVSEADAARAAEDALYIAALEAQAGTTPPNGGPCIPADAAKRIGGIQ